MTGICASSDRAELAAFGRFFIVRRTVVDAGRLFDMMAGHKQEGQGNEKEI
jgi:hypothetical protein